MRPYYEDDAVTLFYGDCVEVMATIEPDSVDAVVCDPPYEIGFMGRAWDASGVAYRPETWAAVLRVLKPGGHLLAFGGTRTYHRMTVAIEDAGFEVRDCIAWMYGSGFPKSLDVSKAIDKAAGAEREVVGKSNRNIARGEAAASNLYAEDEWTRQNGRMGEFITAPATDDARTWSSWGTALKPAHEPIVVARKPLAGTVASNVLAHGTGAINIDATRVGEADGFGGGSKASSGFVDGYEADGFVASTKGRWPANVVLDPEAGAALDRQSGVSKDYVAVRRNGSQAIPNPSSWDKPRIAQPDMGYGSEGGASRFFYCAKASKADRGPGNAHPTVKPVELMRWLVRLVTPPGGTVLDPFAGSGTTGQAAIIEGFHSILIEAHELYLPIIVARISQPLQPDIFGGAA